MSLAEIKKRWMILNQSTQLADDIRKLLAVAEAAKHYWDKYNSDCPLEELNKAETKFSKALAELEGE
jgi:hypothetical protein